MNQQIATTDTQNQGISSVNAFDRMMMDSSSNMNSGAVAIESQRAIAEARGQMQLARMFPRSVNDAMKEFLESCKSPEFAAEAFYTVKNRGSGPSIRFAEEAARCYGHFDYGHRELSRGDGKSEIEVFAWDKEKNNVSKRQITVMHVLDVGGSSRKLTQQGDIDNKIANVASKQMRGRILALLPKHMVAAGKAECQRTLAGGNDKPMPERILRISQRFERLAVTSDQIAAYLGISKVDDMSVEQIGDLQGVYNAIKEGAKISEYFGGEAEHGQDGEQQDTGAAIANLQSRTANNGPAKQGDKPSPASSTDKATTQGGAKSNGNVDAKSEARGDGVASQKHAAAKKETAHKKAAPPPADSKREPEPLDNLLYEPEPEHDAEGNQGREQSNVADGDDVF